MTATQNPLDLPQTRAQLVVEFEKALADALACRSTLVGKFLVALQPADRACPNHFENVRGRIEWTPYTRAQQYSTLARAERRVADFDHSSVPAGYALVAIEGGAVVDAHVADLRRMIAQYSDIVGA